MSLRIHISIPVSDLERSVHFYETVLGHPVSKRKDDYANFRLDEPPIHLALVPGTPADESDERRHFGVELPDHELLGSWRARVTAADLPVRIDEGATCCYAVADKFWVTDPDGHAWEFWVRTADAESMYEAPKTCCS